MVRQQYSLTKSGTEDATLQRNSSKKFPVNASAAISAAQSLHFSYGAL
jgi:hypothetical protein